jgi:hypothetical protein
MARVYHFGACDLLDALNRSPILREYELASLSDKDYPSLGTSLMSLYTQPGVLAERMYQSMLKQIPNDYKRNSVYMEMIKFPYFKYLKQNVKPGDIMVINFSSEVYTKFSNSSETFSLIPQFKEVEYIDWVRKEILSLNHCHLDFDDDHCMGTTKELLVDFTTNMKEIFGNRIVLVNTHIGDKFILADNNIKTYKASIHDIPYYHNMRFIHDPKNEKYVGRVVDVMVKQFRRLHGYELPIVELDQSFVYIDPNHKWGRSPLHLTHMANEMLSLKILDELRKIK